MTINVLEKAKPKVFTLEEYLKKEEKSLTKNEFLNGQIIPNQETSINHNRIVGNTVTQLSLAIKNTNDSEIFSSNQKIFIPTINSILYPDIFVVFNVKSHLNNLTITNSIIIFEVSSPSMVRYDRSEKFKLYQHIPTFQEYVLIDQDTPSVEVFLKTELGWVVEIYLDLEEVVKLNTIDAEIKMKDIYRNVEDLSSPQGQIEFEEKDA